MSDALRPKPSPEHKYIPLPEYLIPIWPTETDVLDLLSLRKRYAHLYSGLEQNPLLQT